MENANKIFDDIVEFFQTKDMSLDNVEKNILCFDKFLSLEERKSTAKELKKYLKTKIKKDIYINIRSTGSLVGFGDIVISLKNRKTSQFYNSKNVGVYIYFVGGWGNKTYVKVFLVLNNKENTYIFRVSDRNIEYGAFNITKATGYGVPKLTENYLNYNNKLDKMMYIIFGDIMKRNYLLENDEIIVKKINFVNSVLY